MCVLCYFAKNLLYIVKHNTEDREIFVDHLRRLKLNRQNIFCEYKWNKFMLSSGHSDKNKRYECHAYFCTLVTSKNLPSYLFIGKYVAVFMYF